MGYLYFKHKMVKIKENATIARIAAWKLKSKSMAITIGSTIYLHNAKRQTLIQNKAWLRHELKHVEQYQRLGFLRFLVLYIWYSIKHGYYLNPLEIEARLAEQDADILDRHEWIA